MSKAKRSDSLQKKHWSIKAHESLISRNAEGHFCLNVEGGAEAGLMPFVGEIRQDRINYQSGKVYAGEIILEVNSKRVPGMIKKDVIALIKKSTDPVSLVTTKQRPQAVLGHKVYKELCRYSVFPTYARSPANAGYLPRTLWLPQQRFSPPYPATALAPPLSCILPSLGTWTTPTELGDRLHREQLRSIFIDQAPHTLDGPTAGSHDEPHAADCEDTELPYGWEKVSDPVYGTYYNIDHINRVTQYRIRHRGPRDRYAGAQLPQRPDDTRGAPPPLRAPPSMQSAAALEKQREAEAAAQWPEAGLASDYPDYPGNKGGYPGDMMEGGEGGEQDLEADLQGEVVKTTLLKTAAGFGFIITIIGGDRPGELLQIKTIQKGSAADKDGRLQVGDVIGYINGILVLTYNHHKVVDLFKSIPMGSTVTLEVRRGYPLPDYQDDKLAPLHGVVQSELPPPPVSPYLPSGTGGRSLATRSSMPESTRGPVVKQIMDHPRCAQLREGDIIMEVNGEGAQGEPSQLGVIRPAIEELPNYDPGDYLPGDQGLEPFTVLEVRLIRQVSGFGFRIIGGKEEGSQATIGAIVPGGAADLDGRLQIGDEITQINGRSVLDAAHQDVINYMGEAAAQGEVTLKISRKVPPLELNPHTSYMPAEDNEPLIPQGIRRVLITRPNTQTSFGFVLQSNTLRAGCIVCRLVQGSPADQSVMWLTLIKHLVPTITLEVQQPQDLELVKQQQLMDNQPPSQQAVAVVMDNRGRSYSGNTNTLTSSGNYPGNAPSGGTMPGPTTFASQYSVSGGGAPGLQYTGPAGGTSPGMVGAIILVAVEEEGEEVWIIVTNGPDDDAGPQISANLDGFASDDEDILHIEIHRDGTGFGFSIRGGAEYNAPLCVLRMAPGGAAERDGRLRVGDELLEINGNSTEGLGHADAITIIKHGGDIVKLTVRRLPESLSGRSPGLDRTRPADVLVRDWAQGKPAAFDITVPSPLTPAILAEASRRVGAAAEAAENRKHTANDPKCAELGWRCVPLAVKAYCNWGEEARRTLATRLAFGSSSFRKAKVISDMFGRLNITLVRAIARAILAKNVIPTDFN
eukprot:Em0001g3301a